MEESEITPIFLLSLPRSGSTLLQRILANHRLIATAPEPWILVPFLTPFKESGVSADYDISVTNTAVKEFISNLPLGEKNFFYYLRKFVVSLYGEYARNNEQYFLDKSPRYSLVVDNVHKTFPNDKYIYLWRNPLAIIASSINTWGVKGRWNIHRIHVDLFVGLPRLISSSRLNKHKIFICKYEDIVSNRKVLENLYSYLSLDVSDEDISSFVHVLLGGSMGDKTGVAKYMKLDTGSIDSWKLTLNNPIRKWWCKRYLRWLGRENLEYMGYDIDFLIDELYSTRNNWFVLMDIIMITYGYLYGLLNLPLLRINFVNFLKRRRNIAQR